MIKELNNLSENISKSSLICNDNFYEDYVKVIFFGKTKCGKSSLLNIMYKENLIAKNNGIEYILV